MPDDQTTTLKTKKVQIRLHGVDGRTHTTRFDLGVQVGVTDIMLSFSGHRTWAAYLATQNDDELLRTLTNYVGAVIPMAWDKTSRARMRNILQEYERRLNAKGLTLANIIDFYRENSAAQAA